MKRLLDNINSPQDMKGLGTDELVTLATEVREHIIEGVSSTGGHLASSLGAVDLALALHYVFNTPDDKIVWDVGHQAYAHKILTGRRESFKTLRTLGGISGFPKIAESPYDSFGVGHSSTSISAALGMAAARDLAGGSKKVIAVIGDGSMTAGLAYEGLNQAGHIKKDLLVILNDNEMSISRNVGALSTFLSRKITGRFAQKLKGEVEGFIESIPKIGGRLMGIAKRAEDSLITFLTPGMIFEGFGFNYLGPIDGHDMGLLVNTLRDVKDLKGPVLLHVMTKKGKGYAPAEAMPSQFHGVGPFDAKTGIVKKSSAISYTKVFSDAILDCAGKNKKVVAITAAMLGGTGLSAFQEKFPERFFDVGIAEQHALTFAAGLATEGFVPVAAIYSTFLQRAFDEVCHDVCLQNLHVVMALDRAGIVGSDGPTHHGIFDISSLRPLPNIVVAAPKDGAELRNLIFSAIKYKAPVVVRYPRGKVPDDYSKEAFAFIEPGKAELLSDGSDVAILALGSMVYPAIEAARELEKSGVKTAVVNARFVKPLDEDLITRMAESSGKIVTVEEGALQGGFGSAVMELFEQRAIQCPLKRLGIPDTFIEHGTQEELRGALGLDAGGIEESVRTFLNSSDIKPRVLAG